MEKRKPNDLPPEQCLAVDTDTLCKLLCCGRHTAVQIGDLANARITMNTRVLWSVQRIKEYLYDIPDDEDYRLKSIDSTPFINPVWLI